jgi:hypothetical protein
MHPGYYLGMSSGIGRIYEIMNMSRILRLRRNNVGNVDYYIRKVGYKYEVYKDDKLYAYAANKRAAEIVVSFEKNLALSKSIQQYKEDNRE